MQVRFLPTIKAPRSHRVPRGFVHLLTNRDSPCSGIVNLK